MMPMLSKWMSNGLAVCLALSASLYCSTTAAKNACDLATTVSAAQGPAGLCGFDPSIKSFKGSKKEQAQCLTRQVKKGAHIGEPTITNELIGLLSSAAPDMAKVKSYLDEKGIKEADLGGQLSVPITARYLIIHDTSTPNCSDEKAGKKACPTLGEFPPNLNDADWSVNKGFLGHPKNFPDRLAHAFTNRVGASITEVDFKDHITTTKFEKCFDADKKQKLFVGIENIQPRIGDPAIPKPGKKPNDLIAPIPGLTGTQYDRLALLYIVASTRRGEWLVLAHHGVLDQYFADGHDDPQNFDMNKFSAAVMAALARIK